MVYCAQRDNVAVTWLHSHAAIGSRTDMRRLYPLSIPATRETRQLTDKGEMPSLAPKIWFGLALRDDAMDARGGHHIAIRAVAITPTIIASVRPLPFIWGAYIAAATIPQTAAIAIPAPMLIAPS